MKELGSAFSGFEAQSEIQAEAVQNINEAIADGIITAEEARKIGPSLRILLSTLTTYQQENQGLILDLIGQMQRFSLAQDDARTKTKQLTTTGNAIR